ncbi:chemotaxis protein CheA, partial [Paracraurococcus ruber]
LRRLGGCSGPAALPVLGLLRRQMQLLTERCGEEAGATALAEVPEAEKAMRPALAGLAVRLEAIVAGAAADAGAVVAESREAAALAAGLGLDEIEALLLRIEDLADRAGEPEAAELLARDGPALAEQLRLTAETGLLRGAAPGRVEAADAALPSQVPPEFAPVLGPEGRGHLEAALAAGTPLYRAQIAIGAPPELEARLEAWLREETQPITSRTVLQGPRAHLDMLLAAATPLPDLLKRMERIDPAHRLMLSLVPLARPEGERAAPVTMRVRQDTVDGIIALEAEARAAALALNEALHDEAALEALARLGRLERRLSGPAARELMGALDVLRRLQEQLGRAEGRLALALRQLDEAVLGLRVVPIGTLFARLPRVVRAVAEAGGKEVEVVFEGRDVQIDRSLVELLADPLLHLVRNAVDHGIEGPAERAAAGKPRGGTLRIAAARRLSQIRLTVSDDGRGIDREGVLRRAIHRGLVAEEAAPRMTDAEVQALLFTPGFSTAEAVTETSGRGVGLDVVQDAARRAGGALEVESALGRGTTFRLMLPVTAAVQTVLLVEVGGHPYALPAARVEGVLDSGTPPDCAVVALAAMLGLDPEVDAPGGVVLVRSAGRPLGLQVDRVRRRTNLLLRPMHPGFAGLPAVAGLGVLGNGDPVVVLEPDALAPA